MFKDWSSQPEFRRHLSSWPQTWQRQVFNCVLVSEPRDTRNSSNEAHPQAFPDWTWARISPGRDLNSEADLAPKYSVNAWNIRNREVHVHNNGASEGRRAVWAHQDIRAGRERNITHHVLNCRGNQVPADMWSRPPRPQAWEHFGWKRSQNWRSNLN